MEILFEDEFVIGVNKSCKQFIHPMAGEKESKDCLLFEVRDHLNKFVYPINRLDRPVSGIVLFGKAPEIVTQFQDIWHDTSTKKSYLCLHRGLLESPGVFDSPLSKRGAYKSVNKEIKQPAITRYTPLKIFKKEFCTFSQVEIKTGRYHQIRRHFRKAIMPIIGDTKHGKGKVNHHFRSEYDLNRIFLHSSQFECVHPVHKKILNIKCPIPQELEDVLEKLGSSFL